MLNQVFIYDLDEPDSSSSEIYDLNNIEKLMDPDKFVNSGVVHTYINP